MAKLENGVAQGDARWIVKHAEAGGVLKHRQALPKEAFLSLTDLIDSGMAIMYVVHVKAVWICIHYTHLSGKLLGNDR